MNTYLAIITTVFQNPIKMVMVIIMLAMVIPAAVALAMGWKKACQECSEQTEPQQRHCERSEKDEKEDPCERCLRWPECNGVDEACPVRKHDIK